MKQLTDEFKKEIQNYNQKQLNQELLDACDVGNLEMVTYLLTSSDLKRHADIHANGDSMAFIYACSSGHLEVARYLLTEDLGCGYVDINSYEDSAFIAACENGHLNVVRYLLTSTELKYTVDIHTEDDDGFKRAFKEGQIHILEYLLTSKELTDHIDIHQSDVFYKNMCNYYFNSHSICYILSLTGEQCIDFQRTECNLEWAIAHQHDEIIIAMMENLKKNNFMNYLECLSKIEIYNTELYEKVKKMEINDCEINSLETVLFP